MSKITFRADDTLVERVERMDASKSEVMREALRAYLESGAERPATDSLDDLIERRVDELLATRAPSDDDVSVTITLKPDGVLSDELSGTARGPVHRSLDNARKRPNTCPQCGESIATDHVYCPNCGEQAGRRVFCECGDELQSDWSYCPNCGRRTASADVLEP